MRKSQLRSMPLIFTIINLILGAMILWTTILLIMYVVKFAKEAKGFMYAKEFNEYVHNMKDKVNSHQWSKGELELFIKTFNNKYGSEAIKINWPKSTSGTPSAAVISKMAKDVGEQIQGLFNSGHDESKVAKALIDTSNDQALAFLKSSSNWKVESFVKSALTFAKHIDYRRIAHDVENNDVEKGKMISYMFHGVIDWFIDVNKEFLVVCYVYIICWALAIIFSIFQKISRSIVNLKGGAWAIVWAIFIPLLGFIFYPLITFTYLFRNKPKKVLVMAP